MMSTYELFIVFLSTNSSTSSEITTIQPKKVFYNSNAEEIDAASEPEL